MQINRWVNKSLSKVDCLETYFNKINDFWNPKDQSVLKKISLFSGTFTVIYIKKKYVSEMNNSFNEVGQTLSKFILHYSPFHSFISFTYTSNPGRSWYSLWFNKGFVSELLSTSRRADERLDVMTTSCLQDENCVRRRMNCK